MPNQSGNAYALTTLCPIVNDVRGDQSCAAHIRHILHELPENENSPMAAIPNTYLCRMFVLDDVLYQGHPAKLDRLKSKYLVFTSNFHGERDAYLTGMWNHASKTIRRVWEFCVDFERRVNDASSFVDYIKDCQVKTTFFFNGSSSSVSTGDEPLDVQLKSLYLKQELSKFAFKNQGKSASALQAAFEKFVAHVEPRNLARPTFRPGASELKTAVIK